MDRQNGNKEVGTKSYQVGEVMAYKDKQWCKERGICTRCKKQEAFNGRALCADCAYYYSEYYHTVRKVKSNEQLLENAKKYQKKKRDEMRTKGLCIKCGKPVCERSKVYCDYHRLLSNKQALERYYRTHVYKTEEEMKVIKAEAAKRVKEGWARWYEEKLRKKAESIRKKAKEC